MFGFVTTTAKAIGLLARRKDEKLGLGKDQPKQRWHLCQSEGKVPVAVVPSPLGSVHGAGWLGISWRGLCSDPLWRSDRIDLMSAVHLNQF